MIQTDHNGRSGSREGLVSHGTGSPCRSAPSPASGIVGPKTWKPLLERWAALCPLPLA
jgi:hypothetical protein